MPLPILPPLRRNYQRISTNRFIVDSPRFWREEFHPHFGDIFEFDDYYYIVKECNDFLSFKYSNKHIENISSHLEEYFSGYRTAWIPEKMPQGKQMFLSDLYFVLSDILPRLQFKDWFLIPDDFNVVNNEGNWGGKQRGKVNVGETEHNDSNMDTSLDILTMGNLKHTFGNGTENTDTHDWHNEKSNTDVFMSAQNQGKSPITESEEFKGVDGVTLNPSGGYHTNSQSSVEGDSTLHHDNVSNQSMLDEQELTQNNDAKTAHGTKMHLGMEQAVENETEHSNDYMENLHFDRAKKLQEYYNIAIENLWNEILGRLNKWILQVHIATADYNYNECNFYE